MTEVKVIGKYINVLPIQELINSQETLVDDIYFMLDNYVDGIDFSDWSWRVYYKTALDDGYTTLVDSEYDDITRTIRVHWRPDKEITQRSGWLTIQLRASKDTEEGMLKWSTAVASVNIRRALQPDGEETREGVMEEYLDRMESLAQSSMSDYHEVSSQLHDEIERATAAEEEIRQEIGHSVKRIEKTKIKLNLATAFEKGESGTYDTLCIGLAADITPSGETPVFPDYIDVVSDVTAHYN